MTKGRYRSARAAKNVIMRRRGYNDDYIDDEGDDDAVTTEREQPT